MFSDFPNPAVFNILKFYTIRQWQKTLRDSQNMDMYVWLIVSVIIYIYI